MTRVPMTDRLEKALETLLGRATPYELAYMVGTEEYRELQAAYREARALPDTSALEAKAIEAARAIPAIIYFCQRCDTDPALLDALRRVKDSLNALDAARKPKAEAWQVTANNWRAGNRSDLVAWIGDDEKGWADFHGPNAERHAREWADARNAEVK